MINPSDVVKKVKERVVTLRLIATDRASIKITELLNSGDLNSLVSTGLYGTETGFEDEFKIFKKKYESGYKDVEEIYFKIFEIIFDELREAKHQNLHKAFLNCLETVIDEYKEIKSAIRTLSEKFDDMDFKIVEKLNEYPNLEEEVKEDLTELNSRMKSIEIHTQAVLGCAMTGQFKKPVIADDGK